MGCLVAILAAGNAARTTRAAPPAPRQAAPGPAASAQGVAAQQAGAAKIVVASVAGNPITLGEVDQALLAALGGRPVPEHSLVVLRAKVLNELIDRRLVETAIQREAAAVSPEEIAREREQLAAQLKNLGQSIEGLLSSRGWDESQLRAHLEAAVRVSRYLDARMDQAAMDTFFAENRRRFDGSQVRVRHILLRPIPGLAAHQLVDVAQQIRRQIESGELRFEDAVAKYSDGPSRRDQGELGWVGTDSGLSEPFVQEAFALEPGAISEPVVSDFGVHLLQATEIKPGDKPLSEVTAKVRAGLMQEVLRDLAAGERQRTPVEFSGAIAYYDPQTRQLVLPTNPSPNPPAADR